MKEIVVMSKETSTPTLRASLRRDGMHIPPAFARLDWGPAAIREAAPDASASGPVSASGGPASGGPTSAPPVQMPQPHDARETQPRPRPPASTPGGFPDPGAEHARGYDPSLPPTGSYPVGDEPGADYYDSGSDSEFNATPPRPSDAYSSFDPSGGAGYPPPDMDPPTAQIDASQALAMATRAEQVGDSTTQASHRTERLDLSDWGYLLRVVMIADPATAEPRQALEQMAPSIGDWLRAQIQQPARLEYDRRFRHETEKMLAKFLTEREPRFPVIKAELQYIE